VERGAQKVSSLLHVEKEGRNGETKKNSVEAVGRDCDCIRGSLIPAFRSFCRTSEKNLFALTLAGRVKIWPISVPTHISTQKGFGGISKKKGVRERE